MVFSFPLSPSHFVSLPFSLLCFCSFFCECCLGLLDCLFVDFFSQLEEMDHFAQKPYFCSQSEEVVGAENIFGPHSAFQPFSNQFGEHRVEKRVEERGEEEEDNVEIIAAPKKRTTLKSKAAPKKKIAKVKVESEGDGDGVRRWLDFEILQLIAFHGEMKLEFVRNGKKQGIFLKS